MVLVHVLRRNVVVTAALFALTGTANADSDDNVAGRLSSHGGLSSSASKKLVSKVNVRMAKAADATAGANDPMRAAVSLALFQTPQPPNSMAAAKVRLRLYAGLNEWALEAIFAPQPGVVAGCVREIGATTSECEALVAAAAKSSVAQIRSVAGGSAAPAAAPAFAGQAPAATGGGRFSRFNSGYQANPQYGAPQQYQAAPQYRPQGYRPQQYQAAPQYRQPAYPQQQYQAAPRFQAPAQQYQRPAAPAYQRPMPQQQQAYQRPAAPAYVAPVAPPPSRPVVSAAEQQSRKEAYKAQREAYLARKKAEFEQRRQKMNSVHQADASEAPPREGEGVPAGQSIQATAAAPAKAPAKAASAPAAAEPEAEEPTEAVAAKGSEKPALDNDFLDGLLEDPLANKKKK